VAVDLHLKRWFKRVIQDRPILVVTQSKSYVCGRSPAEIVGSNPYGT
jgi:hypothetical protein